MPGLSNDPEKRARQLAGLRAGRLALAKAEQARVEAGEPPADPGAGAASPAPGPPPAPAAPAQPTRQSREAKPAAGAGEVRAHTWGAPPAPPEPESEPAPVPVAEGENVDFTSERPRRGRLGKFFEGFGD